MIFFIKIDVSEEKLDYLYVKFRKYDLKKKLFETEIKLLYIETE